MSLLQTDLVFWNCSIPFEWNYWWYLAECWERCACWTVPYAQGGGNGMTTYCGNWDNGTGQVGGTGVVKITYV